MLGFLGFLLHHPVLAVILIAAVMIGLALLAHAAPDVIQEQVDERSAKKFKASRKQWAYNERIRQAKNEARRESGVFARHEPLRKKAQRLSNSSSPRRQKKGQALLKEHRWLVKKEMSIVHHAAKSARVHPSGKIDRGIRRD